MNRVCVLIEKFEKRDYVLSSFVSCFVSPVRKTMASTGLKGGGGGSLLGVKSSGKARVRLGALSVSLNTRMEEVADAAALTSRR